MTLGNTARRILLGLGMLLVLALVANGVFGGIGQLRQAATLGRRVQSDAQIALGGLGIVWLLRAGVARPAGAADPLS